LYEALILEFQDCSVYYSSEYIERILELTELLGVRVDLAIYSPRAMGAAEQSVQAVKYCGPVGGAAGREKEQRVVTLDHGG
jgi:hypothetical protein